MRSRDSGATWLSIEWEEMEEMCREREKEEKEGERYSR